MQTADAEKSLKAAQRMVSFMDASDMAAIASEDGDETAVAELYHTCARICLQGDPTVSMPVVQASAPSPSYPARMSCSRL